MTYRNARGNWVKNPSPRSADVSSRRGSVLPPPLSRPPAWLDPSAEIDEGFSPGDVFAAWMIGGFAVGGFFAYVIIEVAAR